MCDHKFRPSAVSQDWRKPIGNRVIVVAGWECVFCQMVPPACFYPTDSAIAASALN